MRDYAKVTPDFWTGDFGRRLRGDPSAQLVALYLITSPHANMIGIYHCPIIYISHETGLPIEGASKGLRSLIEAEFCTYDEATDLVWVHEMARFQVGEALKAADKRVSGILKDFEKVPNGLIKQGFFARYRAAFHLPEPPNLREMLTPFEGPSKPLRSQEQEQEQKQEQEIEQEHVAEDVRAPTITLPAVIVQSDGPAAADDWPDGPWDKLLVALVRSPWLDPDKSHKLVMSAGLLAAWKRAGASWEFDVIPVVMALCAKAKGPISSWNYFRDAVLQSAADNRQALTLPEASAQRLAPYRGPGGWSAMAQAIDGLDFTGDEP